MLFMLGLKWNLCDKAFSCVKTKTNSDFGEKVVERSKRSFWELPSSVHLDFNKYDLIVE